MRLLALTKYGPLAASTRQRFVQYEQSLADANIEVIYSSLLDDSHVQRLADARRASPLLVAAAYAHRVMALLGARKYDALWIHYELFPYLPATFERAAFLHGKPVIFDYDDAVFHTYDSSPSSITRWVLGGKLAPLIAGATVVCCGNEYLRSHASRYNPNSVILPTVVDTDRYRPVIARRNHPLTIGWIGSPSTWRFVRPYLPLLAELCRDRDVRFVGVGAGRAAEADRFDGLTLEKWSEAGEIASVQAMDIGIMPLPDAPWARGKCGYKLIQYMACGLSVVASPVGVNSDIVVEGTTGFLATSIAQWRSALNRLIDDAELRRRMGEAGRVRAEEAYSLQVHAPRLVDIMLGALESREAAQQIP
jgi:glycosyltransferase involved in cell wall biosynthesis